MKFTYQPGEQPLVGYTIQRGIRRGGFGEVYFARSDGGKDVALKLLQNDQEVELRGVRQCLNLKHPNLVTLFDVKTDGHGDHWVVMEYVQGSSLEDVLQSFPGGLSPDEVFSWVEGIADGVSYLHERGIIHRDLKPANVYRENGLVKVGDVGLSKRLGSDRRGAHTQSVGTVYYMAPEVGRGQYGPEVDVYSLGVMIYEMLTGRLPFEGESVSEILMKHMTAPPDLAAVSAEFQPFLQRALAKDPQRRTPSVQRLKEELRQVCSGNAELLTAAVPASTTRVAEAELVTTQPIPGAPPPVPHSPARAASAYAQGTATSRQTAEPRTESPQPAPRARRMTEAPEFRPASVNWQLVSMIVVGLLLFARGTWRAWGGLGMAIAAIGVTSWMRGRDGHRMHSMQRPEIRGNAPREHLQGDLWTALSVGSVSAALGSVATVCAADFLRTPSTLPAPETLTLFTVTSLIATWLVLIGGDLRRRSRWVQLNSRKSALVLGTVMGSTAWGLHHWLVQEPQSLLRGSDAAFRSLGIHQLLGADQTPTWLGYVVFFGGMMVWYHWWHDISPQRSRQLSIGRLLTAGFCAWLLTSIFAFPQGLGVMWALTISAAVQLATPWRPAHLAARS